MTDYSIDIIKDTSYTIELNEQGPQGIQGERGIQGPEGPIGPKGDKGDVGEKGDTGVSVIGVEEISKVGLVTTYRMMFSDGEYFDYEVTDGSIDGLTRETIINIIGYEPASYTSVEGLTTRVSTLEERVEDLTASKFPNVVIVGAPHIEGGQVSGYSNTNYLQFPFVDISRGLPFDIYFSFTTGSDVTTQQNILDSYFGIALAIQNSKGVMALSSNGTSWDIGNVTGTNTILPNTTYYAKCSWTGTQYNTSLSTNDTTYIPDMVLSSTLTTNKTTIFIGGSPDLFGAGAAHPFKGTINFNNSRVDVQGTTVWEGMADVGLASRANVSLNNLDEVGEKRFTDIQVALDGKQDKGTTGSGLELCDIGMALYVDETKGLRRYLNGQIVDINTNTQAFFTRLQDITTLHPSLLCTEEEWQTAKTMSAFGQVGKFVFNYSGEDIVSVRIPAIVNVQGLFDLQNLGMTVGAGLPNIDGSISELGSWGGPTINKVGAFSDSSSRHQGTIAGGNLNFYRNTLSLNASLSNPIYGNSTTVQQEAIQYPYFIQIATGSETEANIINTIENVNGFTLLESKYSDKPLYNESWLLSNGQWNAKAVYPTVYEALQVEYNSEIEAGTTVTLPSGVSYTKRGLSVKLSTETYTDYGFVLNTADETFRLPLKTKLASGKAVVGNGMTLGLTNGTQLLGAYGDGNYGLTANTGTTYGSDIGSTRDGSGNWITGFKTFGITTDPTKSGIELSDSGLYLYYYVGETVQNANLIDAGRIGEQLANKTDMLQASGAGMPSNKYIDLTLGASGSTYIAPANGYIVLGKTSTASGQYLSLFVSATQLQQALVSSASGQNIASFLSVKKDSVVTITYSLGGTTTRFRFIYAEGEV